MDTENRQKCLTITIAGATNAGKSSLINRLVGSKVSIVTPKVQTTRTKLRAITIFENTQMILTDTPGIFHAKTSFDQYLVNNAWGALRDCDLAVLLVDARKPDYTQVLKIMDKVKRLCAKTALVINKIDATSDLVVREIQDYLSKLCSFDEIFAISVLKNWKIDDLLVYFSSQAPEGPWLYPEDQLVDAPTKFIAAEITREKLFLNLAQELPYSVAVQTEQMQEKPDGSVIIRQAIYVLKQNHKAIVIGARGARIKIIGSQSKADLEEILDREVHLFLFVKVCEFWQNRPQEYI